MKVSCVCSSPLSFCGGGGADSISRSGGIACPPKSFLDEGGEDILAEVAELADLPAGRQARWTPWGGS